MIMDITDMKHVVRADFHVEMFCFTLSENLQELLMKDVFETMFCLHEVSQSSDLFKLLELLLCMIMIFWPRSESFNIESKVILTLT